MKNFESNVQYIKYLVNKEVTSRFISGTLVKDPFLERDIAEAIIAVKEELKEDNIRTTPLRLAFYAIKGAISGLADSAIETLAEQAIKLLQ